MLWWVYGFWAPVMFSPARRPLTCLVYFINSSFESAFFISVIFKWDTNHSVIMMLNPSSAESNVKEGSGVASNIQVLSRFQLSVNLHFCIKQLNYEMFNVLCCWPWSLHGQGQSQGCYCERAGGRVPLQLPPQGDQFSPFRHFEETAPVDHSQ